MNPFTVARASGSRIWDSNGVSYLDFAGNVGCANIGHNHPQVVEAIRDQAGRVLLSAAQLALHDRYLPLCERLVEQAAIPGQKRAFLVNSGAEAVENAVKVARGFTGRKNVVSFANAFHGRTALGATLSGDPEAEGYSQLAINVLRTQYPQLYRGLSSPSDEIACVMADLQHVVDDAGDVAAVILEPIQGEGGYVMPPGEFFGALSVFCRERGIVMIADEIQSGFGRTGTFFASERLGFVPHLITFGKSIANGLPLAGLLGRAEVMDGLAPGGLGGTYGGNPVACAAAEAVLDVIEDEQLLARAESIGAWIEARTRDYTTRFSLVGDVRITGAMAALELVTDQETKVPATAECLAFMTACRERGLLVVPAGPNRNVIRFLGPLTLTDEELDEGFSIIESVLESMAGSVRNLV